MIVSHCPRCSEAFRIPDAALPEDAFAQCPWCRETIPISEVVQRLPPVLEILSSAGQPLDFSQPIAAPATANASGGTGSYNESEPLSNRETVQYDPDLDLAEFDDGEDDFDEMKTVTDETVTNETWSDDSVVLNDAEDHPEIDLEIEGEGQSWSQESASGRAAVAPMRVSSAPAGSRKSQGSPIKKLLSYALGGIIAVPLAIGILWVINATGVKEVDLGFWPLNGYGSSVSASDNTFAAAPIDLTARPRSSEANRQALRNKSRSLLTGDEFESETMVDPADTALQDILDQDDSDLVNDAATELLLPENSLIDVEDLPASEPTETSPETGTSPLEETSPEAEPTPETTDVEIRMPAQNDESAVTIAPIEPETASTQEIPQDDTTPSEVELPATSETVEPQLTQTDSAELVAARTKADEMLGTLSNTDRGDAGRRKQLAATYAAIAEVGALAGDSPSVKELLQRIKSSDVVEDLAEAAPQWLKYSRRTSDGVLLAGRPGSGENGQTVAITDDNVVKLSDASKKLPESDRVIGIGRIIEGSSGQTVELVAVEPLP